MMLPDRERYLVVFHLVEKYSLEEASDFIGVTYKDAAAMLETACRRILAALDFNYSMDQLKNRLQSLIEKIDPPASAWQEIELSIRKEKVEIKEKMDKALEEELKQKLVEEESVKKEPEKKTKKLKKAKKSRNFSMPAINFGLLGKVLLVFILAAAIYYFIFSTGGGWEVTSVYGTVLVNDKPAVKGDNLTEEGWITAKENSSYGVAGPSASIRGSAGSMIKLDGKKNLEFASGEFNIVKSNTPDVFSASVFGVKIIAEVPAAVIHVDIETNKAAVKCNKNNLKLQRTVYEFRLPSGYVCEIDRFSGPGLPYSINASEQFQRLAKDFSMSVSENDVLVSGMIPLASPHDFISLWNMIKYISPLMRGELFDFIARNTTIPGDITRKGIIYLDEKMLTRLFTVLELVK